ncbi:AIR synthase related protein [Jhaorihella thermophila]
MSPELQERTLAEIMAAAQEVMGEAGAAIVGGHTSMGDELTVGFTVTGLCDGDPVTLAGGRPGDALILTKPLGSGVLMAAEMGGRARRLGGGCARADVPAAGRGLADPVGRACDDRCHRLRAGRASHGTVRSIGLRGRTLPRRHPADAGGG